MPAPRLKLIDGPEGARAGPGSRPAWPGAVKLQPFSLKSKLALICTALSLVLVMLLTALQIYYQKQEITQLVSAQQFTLVTRAAQDLDDKFEVRAQALVNAAATIPETIVNDADGLLRLQDVSLTLLSLFDDVYVFSGKGEMLIDVPRVPGRRGADVSQRDYFKQTVDKRMPVISQPFITKTRKNPGIMMTAPIFDKQGRVVAVLGGFLNLMKPNFLGSLGDTQIGRTGYFYILTKDAVPHVVIHPVKEMVMQPAPGPAANPSMARALAGFEGTLEGVNSRGLRGVFSYKSLQTTNWLLAAVMPTEEAYAPIVNAQRRILWISAALALAIAPLIWLLAYRLISPLTALRDNMREIRRLPASAQELSIRNEDEIGDLTREFNSLMRERRQAEESLRGSEEHFRSVAQSANDAVISADESGSIVSWNSAAQRIFGRDDSEIIGKSFTLLMPERYRQAHAAGVKRLLGSGQARASGKTTELTACGPDACEFPIELSLSTWHSHGQLFYTAVVRDISERKRAQAALAESEEKLRTISDNMPALIGYVDKEERYRFNNKTYEHWYGLKRDEMYGRTMRSVLGDTRYAEIASQVSEALAGTPVTHEREYTINGVTRHVRSTYLPHFGSARQVLGFYVLVNDVTEQKETQQRLQHMAQHDSLTGLPNRALFRDRLEQAVERSKRGGRPMAVMYLDIDHFKSINDSAGHAVGDELLRAFAARLTASVRSVDTVARLGGDEFAVVLEQLNDVGEASAIGQKIVAAMKAQFAVEGTPIAVTASVGIAFSDKYGDEDIDALVRRADRALYEAKDQGRDTYRLAA